MNEPTIAVAAALVLILGLIICKMLRDKKSGKGGCHCGSNCGGCAGGNACHHTSANNK